MKVLKIPRNCESESSSSGSDPINWISGIVEFVIPDTPAQVAFRPAMKLADVSLYQNAMPKNIMTCQTWKYNVNGLITFKFQQGVNFINILFLRFFCMKVICAAFFSYISAL